MSSRMLCAKHDSSCHQLKDRPWMFWQIHSLFTMKLMLTVFGSRPVRLRSEDAPPEHVGSLQHCIYPASLLILQYLTIKALSGSGINDWGYISQHEGIGPQLRHYLNQDSWLSCFLWDALPCNYSQRWAMGRAIYSQMKVPLSDAFIKQTAK